ncbi:N-acetyl-alpha-D-glucosaminyl L-malate synthase BshA [soil metagenome]
MPLRIGIVCYPTFGGSGVVATELGLELARRGHDVHFVTYGLPVRLGTAFGNLHHHEVVVSDYPLFDYPPYETVLASRLVDVTLHERLDLLHVHYAIPHASAAFVAREILRARGVRVPFITTLHGTDITLVGKDPAFAPVIAFAIESSDAVTAVSESLRTETYAHFDVDRPIEVIPNFIDMERYGPRTTDELPCVFNPDGERLLLHVSNFRPVKRVLDVVRIFALVRARIPCKLLLVGDGPDRPAIEALGRELGTHADTHFLGKVTDVERIYRLADVFLLPSEAESFGLAALEAMACGVPVVSSDRGGLPEVNLQGITGFLRPLGDVEGMAHDVLRILEDAEEGARLGAGARAHARVFATANVVPRYEDLYHRTLAATTSRARVES